MEHCATCKYFDSIDRSKANDGWCRLEPPKVIPVNNRNQHDERETKPFTAWPLVHGHDWCGEWARRSEAVAVGVRRR